MLLQTTFILTLAALPIIHVRYFCLALFPSGRLITESGRSIDCLVAEDKVTSPGTFPFS